MRITSLLLSLSLLSVPALVGCGPVDVDFATIEKPALPEELAPLGEFVGNWAWEAERVLPDGGAEKWTGTTTWGWTLGDMYLRGDLELNGPKSFVSSGYWGWHPKKKTYVWYMLNDWGYPQEGTAKYDDETKCWTMNYSGVGLDGTNSRGRYTCEWKDENTVYWTCTEWVPMTFIKKLEMTGHYKRK